MDHQGGPWDVIFLGICGVGGGRPEVLWPRPELMVEWVLTAPSVLLGRGGAAEEEGSCPESQFTGKCFSGGEPRLCRLRGRAPEPHLGRAWRSGEDLCSARWCPLRLSLCAQAGVSSALPLPSAVPAALPLGD